MSSPYFALLSVFAIVLIILSVVGYFVAKDIRRAVEKALEETAGDDEAQAEIRKRIVKAMFPPRFDS